MLVGDKIKPTALLSILLPFHACHRCSQLIKFSPFPHSPFLDPVKIKIMFFQVQPCCRQLRKSHTPWEQFRYSASIKWGLPKAAPWQVCSTHTQHWKQEPTWVWGGRDDEEKLQNEGSRRSLTFSTYLNETA